MLAVSGLHVGILFVVLNYFFSLFFPGNLRTNRLARSFVVLLCLWFFAFLTEFSPSVSRSAIMFSFLQVGLFLQRPYCIYSSLFASAFVLLLYDPSYLSDVGFQLSYTALLSILFFYPYIIKFLKIDDSRFFLLPKCLRSPLKWLTAVVVESVSVSMAAQIGTVPLLLFYFHQFSNVFWLSGVLIIPLAALVVYLSLSFFLFYWVPLLSTLLATLLSFVVGLMNCVVNWFASLPFAVVDCVDFRVPEMLVTSLAIIVGGFYLSRRKFIYFGVSASLMCVVLVISIFRCVSAPKQTLVVFNMPGKSVVNLYSRNSNQLLTTADSLLVCRQLSNLWLKTHAEKPTISNSKLLFVGGKSVYVLDRDISKLSRPKLPHRVNCLVVSNDIRIPSSLLRSFFHYDHLVVDSSCSVATSNWWKLNFPEASVVRLSGDYICYSN